MGIIALQKIWAVASPYILTAIFVYACLVAILSIFQAKFIYFPQRQLDATPEAIGLVYETVHFETSDGIKLSAWFIPAQNARGVVLFCHGNAGNISHRLDSINIFNRLGLSVFIFDYRGFGQSQGATTEQGTYLDAEAAWDYLIKKKQQNIFIFGRSLGGAIATWLAQHNTPTALIIESTFTSTRDVAAKFYPFLPVRLFLRFKYNAKKYIQQVNCPVLIIHSRNDELIPFNHGRQLFETANEPKEFLEIQGSHNDGFYVSGKLYQEGLDRFISQQIK